MDRLTVLSRIAVRMRAAVWRHRWSWLVGVVLVVALGGYAAWSIPSFRFAGRLAEIEVAGVQSHTGDCADTAMEAVATTTQAAARAAYHCMGDAFTRMVGEEEFVQQLVARPAPAAERVTRVGQYHALDGGLIVYFAVDHRGTSRAYVVYLSSDGKVQAIEH
jgi:hypothetical protein